MRCTPQKKGRKNNWSSRDPPRVRLGAGLVVIIEDCHMLANKIHQALIIHVLDVLVGVLLVGPG